MRSTCGTYVAGLRPSYLSTIHFSYPSSLTSASRRANSTSTEEGTRFSLGASYHRPAYPWTKHPRSSYTQTLSEISVRERTDHPLSCSSDPPQQESSMAILARPPSLRAYHQSTPLAPARNSGRSEPQRPQLSTPQTGYGQSSPPYVTCSTRWASVKTTYSIPSPTYEAPHARRGTNANTTAAHQKEREVDETARPLPRAAHPLCPHLVRALATLKTQPTTSLSPKVRTVSQVLSPPLPKPSQTVSRFTRKLGGQFQSTGSTSRSTDPSASLFHLSLRCSEGITSARQKFCAQTNTTRRSHPNPPTHSHRSDIFSQPSATGAASSPSSGTPSFLPFHQLKTTCVAIWSTSTTCSRSSPSRETGPRSLTTTHVYDWLSQHVRRSPLETSTAHHSLQSGQSPLPPGLRDNVPPPPMLPTPIAPSLLRAFNSTARAHLARDPLGKLPTLRGAKAFRLLHLAMYGTATSNQVSLPSNPLSHPDNALPSGLCLYKSLTTSPTSTNSTERRCAEHAAMRQLECRHVQRPLQERTYPQRVRRHWVQCIAHTKATLELRITAVYQPQRSTHYRKSKRR